MSPSSSRQAALVRRLPQPSDRRRRAMTSIPHWSELIKVGDASPALRHPVTFEAIQTFAELTGDFDPIHVDRAYAKGLSHADCLAHGVMVLGLMSDKLLAEDR